MIAMNTGIEQETAHIDAHRKHQRSRRHHLTIRRRFAARIPGVVKVDAPIYQYGFGDGSGNVYSIQVVM